MSQLTLLINRRKYTRKVVTERFNQRESFRDLSLVERNSLKSRLTEHAQTLKSLDDQILLESGSDTFNYDLYFDEAEAYQTKITACIAQLDSISTNNTNHNSSLQGVVNNLKSPVAPLPKYLGK